MYSPRRRASWFDEQAGGDRTTRGVFSFGSQFSCPRSPSMRVFTAGIEFTGALTRGTSAQRVKVDPGIV